MDNKKPTLYKDCYEECPVVGSCGGPKCPLWKKDNRSTCPGCGHPKGQCIAGPQCYDVALGDPSTYR